MRSSLFWPPRLCTAGVSPVHKTGGGGKRGVRGTPGQGHRHTPSGQKAHRGARQDKPRGSRIKASPDLSPRRREAHSQDFLEPHAPQLFCPECMLWPAIFDRVRAGDRLFLVWNSRKVPQPLRTFGEATGWKNAGSMWTHSPRGGAARATQESGGSVAQPLRSGQSRRPASSLYGLPGPRKGGSPRDDLNLD